MRRTLLYIQNLNVRFIFKLFLVQIPGVSEKNETGEASATAGFRINYNFNTHQLREIEVTFVSDHHRYGQLQRGDILVQINGHNCDSMTEKELNRYLVNSSNPRPPSPELLITQLTIYRPYVPGLASSNGTDEESSGVKTATNGVEPAALESEYEIEEIKLMKQNGAMGLSIVGGGNVACHPFGVDKPGIFISKIVPEGPASRTCLRVGDRLLRVNGVDVTMLSHDECVDELKRNANQVTLTVSHDPQPPGLQEVVLKRSYPEETLGIRINGGIENKSANIYDPNDEGIFVVNIIPSTLAHRDGRLRVGTRIMEVCFVLLFMC